MTTNDSPTPTIYRCSQCGIESREPTCFIGVAKRGPQKYAVNCITCNQPAPVGSTLRGVFAIFGGALLPILLVIGFTRNKGIIFPELLVAALIMQPLAMLLHELGHFLTARLLGLDAILITLGVGPKVWSGKIFGVPLRIHAWPLLGLTYLGSQSLQLLRLRVWMTVLMGPTTNVLLIVTPVLFWDSLIRVIDPYILILWMVYNGLLTLANLVPQRNRRSAQRQRNDGMQLLRIPFKKRADLVIYLSASSLVTALMLYTDGDYVAARDVSAQGLVRLPANPWLSITLSACHINLGCYEAARRVIEPLLETSTTASPAIQAAIANNLGIATWLRDRNTARNAESMLRAEELSNRAHTTYPCVLAYRSTRALLLTATNRPEEALTLLEYTNYERGSASDRGDREIARAFAFRQLDRIAEADHSLAVGLKLNKSCLPWLTTLGLVSPR
jgi:Peptidase family M50